MWFVATAIAFIVCVVLHAIFVRVWPGGNRVIAFFVTGMVVGAGLIGTVSVTYGIATPQTAAAAALYAFSCEIYVFLFTLALSSISANLLARLYDGRMDDARIAQIYDSQRMVLARVQRLLDTGLLRISDDRIEITRKGSQLLTLLNRLRFFFGHDSAPPR